MTLPPPQEPTVWDYVRSLLTPWRGKPLAIPAPDEEPDSPERALIHEITQVKREAAEAALSQPVVSPNPLLTFGDELTAEEPLPERETVPVVRYRWPWRLGLALLLGLLAQSQLEPPLHNAALAVVLYGLAAALLIWSVLLGEWTLPELPPDSTQPFSLSFNWKPLAVTVPLLLIAFLAFGGNKFNAGNLLLWGLGLVYALWAFWLPGKRIQWKVTWAKVRGFMRVPNITLRLNAYHLLVLLVLVLVVFFRVYRLNEVPNEMISDQAEKLLDVNDVLHGQFSIFFPRNTGREAFQFYLTALVSLLFNTGISFTSLKIGTTLAGLFVLPYIYHLGKEMGSRWAGLIAVVLVGIGYWPIVVSRYGLRFPFYEMFVAPALYYLFRGLRKSNRNDFILSGIFLGIGLHGYTPIRILPFLVVLAVALFFLHPVARGKRKSLLTALVLLSFFALILFLPLGRYAQENPDMFGMRALSRLGSTEQPLPGPAGEIFLKNTWNAMTMFFYDNGSIWAHSIPYRPALDLVTAVVYFFGFVLLTVRYIQKRRWQDLLLLIAVPMLLMPSILSLAFPGENPSLNRTTGAIIPVFVIAGLGLESLVRSMAQRANSAWGRRMAVVLGLVLIAWSMQQNFDLVFRQYDKQYVDHSWNTTQIGNKMRAFVESVATPDNIYVVAYPHWIDSRLVAINAGYPEREPAIWPANLGTTVNLPGAKVFFLKPEDTASLTSLQVIYPDGLMWLETSPIKGRDYMIFFVPAQP